MTGFNLNQEDLKTARIGEIKGKKSSEKTCRFLAGVINLMCKGIWVGMRALEEGRKRLGMMSSLMDQLGLRYLEDIS